MTQIMERYYWCQQVQTSIVIKRASSCDWPNFKHIFLLTTL